MRDALMDRGDADRTRIVRSAVSKHCSPTGEEIHRLTSLRTMSIRVWSVWDLVYTGRVTDRVHFASLS